jgi:hypothetical protein
MGFLSKAKYSCLNGDVLKLRRDDYFEPATPLAAPVYIGKREGSFIQDKEIGILYTFIMSTPIPGTVKETKVPQ